MPGDAMRFLTSIGGSGRRPFGGLYAFVAILSLGACSGGSNEAPTVPSPPSVANVAVSLAATSIVAGATTQATVRLTDSIGNELTQRSVSWSSSDTTIATVSSSGLVTGVLAGQAVISAVSETKSGTATLTVTPGPVTIRRGGTYTGSWATNDPSAPAVVIATTEPVIIDHCNLTGKGTLIRATTPGTHITVRNCRGYGLDPHVAGATRGDFFFGFDVGSLTLEHNYMEGVNFGVRLYSDTIGWTPDGPILIRYNQARNLDGAPSDGTGGRDLSHLAFGEDNGNHFVIFTYLRNVHNAEIAWNEVINGPDTSSVGDVINIYRSNGTSGTPIQIHDNYIEGGYGAHVTVASAYTGTGIVMDGSAADDAASATAFVMIHDNQLLNNANTGIGIVVGHDNAAFGNRVLSTGQLADGRWFAQTYGNGIEVWNCDVLPENGATA